MWGRRSGFASRASPVEPLDDLRVEVHVELGKRDDDPRFPESPPDGLVEVRLGAARPPGVVDPDGDLEHHGGITELRHQDERLLLREAPGHLRREALEGAPHQRHVGRVDDSHRRPEAVDRVLQGVVLDRGLHDGGVRDDDLLLVEGAGDGRPDSHLVHPHEAALDLEHVARLDRSLEEQDHPGDEVLRDVLHREADADGEDRAGREEGGEADAEGVEGEAEPHREDDVVDEAAGDAHAALADTDGTKPAAEQALEGPGKEERARGHQHEQQEQRGGDLGAPDREERPVEDRGAAHEMNPVAPGALAGGVARPAGRPTRPITVWPGRGEGSLSATHTCSPPASVTTKRGKASSPYRPRNAAQSNSGLSLVVFTTCPAAKRWSRVS